MNNLELRALQHVDVQTTMEEIKKRLSVRIGHGKTSSGRVSKVRPVNPMESETASVEVPVGANAHELIKLGMVR